MNTALLVSSSSNRLAVMLEKTLWTKEFIKGGEGLAKWVRLRGMG